MPPPPSRLSEEMILAARHDVLDLALADSVAEYIVALVEATRSPEKYSAGLAEWLRWGASSRAAIAIERGARDCRNHAPSPDGFDRGCAQGLPASRPKRRSACGKTGTARLGARHLAARIHHWV